MSSQGITIRGLRELQGAFRQIDRELPKELKLHFRDITEKVIGKVQGKMPRISGEAAGSLTPRATQRGAGIAYPAGGDLSRGAYYPWLDFGGAVGRNKSIKRSFAKGGRYLYPTIAESRDDLEREAEAAVAVVAEQARFEVR